MKRTRERFGIELPDASINGDGVGVSITPNGQPCLLTLRYRADASVVTLAGRLYASSLALAAPGHRAWPADLGPLELIWRSGELTGSLDLNFIERVSLPYLLARLRIAGWSGEGTVTTTLLTGGERLELGQLDLPDNGDSES